MYIPNEFFFYTPLNYQDLAVLTKLILKTLKNVIKTFRQIFV